MAAAKVLAGLAASYATWRFVDGKYQLADDLYAIKKVLPPMLRIAKVMRDPDGSLITFWYQTLAKPGQLTKTMFIAAEDGRKMTFAEGEALSNRVAHWALAKGLKSGDCVSLMMDNCLEYVLFWLGLAKAGVITSLINTNTKGKPLVHAINIADSVAVIFGSEHAETMSEIIDAVRDGGVKIVASFTTGAAGGGVLPAFCDESMNDSLAALPTTPVDERRWKSVPINRACFYIYTSGTTGLPKACNMSHMKLAAIAPNACGMFEVGENDTIYGSGMPLYHSAANLGVLSVLSTGCTYIIRTKFSATNHFEDCSKHGATAMQYIGELCRYLLATPERPSDRMHKVRIAIGNGLRPEIWNEFQRRFGIPEIGEFYGATEANVATFNHCKNYVGQGAVGKAGLIMNKILAMRIVKFDVENELPVRDPSTGFCIEAGPQEAGELIAPIRSLPTAEGSVSNFEGYTSKEATEKKILRDVFGKGDAFFRSGDLIRKDAKGYFYFVDRIGDTFRWKGENVSTMEVSEVLSAFPGILDANVFGVEVPGKDGRACMVAVTLEDGASIDPVKLATLCRANLPSYSIPVFVRFLPPEGVELTGTFKHRKVEYRKEGCDPSQISDKMWWYNAAAGAFEDYGPEEYSKIIAGQAKL